jgi:hypothetical protein
VPTANNEIDECNTEAELIPIVPEPSIRPSPPSAPKRPFSPAPIAHVGSTKKIKMDQSVANQKKKPQSIIKNESISKTAASTIANVNKKQTLPSTHKSSAVVEEKLNKNSFSKDSNTVVSTTLQSSTNGEGQKNRH